MTTLNDIIKECHEISVEKGFYEDVDPFDQRFIGTQIALMHSEISEALIELQSGNYDIYYRKDGKPEGFIVELADFLIRIFDLCGALNLDLTTALEVVDLDYTSIVIDEELHVVNELAILHKELTEALEQVRDNKYGIVYIGKDYTSKGMVCEFARCYKHVVALCGSDYLQLDIYEAVNIKMNYNKTRKYKHGRVNF